MDGQHRRMLIVVLVLQWNGQHENVAEEQSNVQSARRSSRAETARQSESKG
jgi:hypothetical protein